MIIRSDARAGKLKGMNVGCLQFEMAKVEKSNPQTDAIVESAIEGVNTRFRSVEAISEYTAVKGIRRMFSTCGTDPTKERPSGEALIRRVVSGKGIYRVNTAVDVNNSVSLLHGHPCGVYDRDMIRGEVVVSIGIKGEVYKGIHGRLFSAEDRIVTRDEISIFGAPTADSERTSVNLGTKNILMLIYHFGADAQLLLDSIEHAKKLMNRATGAVCVSGEVMGVP